MLKIKIIFFLSVAPEIRTDPKDGVLVVKENQPASMGCEVTKGDPKPVVTWRRKVISQVNFFDLCMEKKLIFLDLKDYPCKIGYVVKIMFLFAN